MHGQHREISPSAERRRPVGAAPLDFYDYGSPAESKSDPPLYVTDDFPDIIPVSEAEVRVVEAWLGDVLDELFGPLP